MISRSRRRRFLAGSNAKLVNGRTAVDGLSTGGLRRPWIATGRPGHGKSAPADRCSSARARRGRRRPGQLLQCLEHRWETHPPGRAPLSAARRQCASRTSSLDETGKVMPIRKKLNRRSRARRRAPGMHVGWSRIRPSGRRSEFGEDAVRSLHNAAAAPRSRLDQSAVVLRSAGSDHCRP